MTVVTSTPDDGWEGTDERGGRTGSRPGSERGSDGDIEYPGAEPSARTASLERQLDAFERQLDVDRFADRVYRSLERKIRIERERRGL